MQNTNHIHSASIESTMYACIMNLSLVLIMQRALLLRKYAVPFWNKFLFQNFQARNSFLIRNIIQINTEIYLEQ